MALFGLIGYPLTHSFSKRYFTEKFEEMGLSKEHQYELFEMPDATAFLDLWKDNPSLAGINITIPHKLSVFDYLDELDISAKKVGAVNVVKKTPDHKLIGYNSDYYGFQRSMIEYVGDKDFFQNKKALVLGNGGAAKAIIAALEELGVQVQIVSRNASEIAIDYAGSDELITTHQFIINCSPLGTYPHTETYPAIRYDLLTSGHYLYDLVYNPSETSFLRLGKENGANTKNGYDMLVYQAEKSWEIWQS